jgi:hypothetical protein
MHGERRSQRRLHQYKRGSTSLPSGRLRLPTDDEHLARRKERDTGTYSRESANGGRERPRCRVVDLVGPRVTTVSATRPATNSIRPSSNCATVGRDRRSDSPSPPRLPRGPRVRAPWGEERAGVRVHEPLGVVRRMRSPRLASRARWRVQARSAAIVALTSCGGSNAGGGSRYAPRRSPPRGQPFIPAIWACPDKVDTDRKAERST